MGREDIENSFQVHTTPEGIEVIKSNTQIYTFQEGIVEIKLTLRYTEPKMV